MASSEPRLGNGEGTTELRTSVPVVPTPPDVHASSTQQRGPATVQASSMTAESSDTNQVSASDSSATGSNDNDNLPPLVSLSDLILEAPAWLFSAALHMIVVIVLGLLFIVPDRPIELLLRLDDNDGFEELDGSEFDLDLDTPEQMTDAALEPQELVALEDPVLVEPTEIEPLVVETESVTVAAPIQMALTGRSEGMQQKLLDAYGGNASTQRAVMMALRWLERYQSSSGMWSLSGNYSDGSRIENREAATGLALLAFQGAGYTPHGDPQHDFTGVTSRAWKSMLRRQSDEGIFFQNAGRHNGQLYTQAICTIALCELYGMTRDSRYREPAQRSINYAIKIQDREGGWRYTPGSDSDLSVTGWFMMAMQSARMAGLEVPTPVLQKISGYLDSVSYKGGATYGYHRSHPGDTVSMTAEGLLCRQYLGWPRDDKRLKKGVSFLLDHLPSWKRSERDVYYWYYATQVCHHMEGSQWRIWNDQMKKLLPEKQVQTGKERGSWDPKGDEWGDQAGRLFTTCLSTFMLEVYYRHLPIYKSDLVAGSQ